MDMPQDVPKYAMDIIVDMNPLLVALGLTMSSMAKAMLMHTLSIIAATPSISFGVAVILTSSTENS
jgi:hypothetical protein